MSNQEPPEQIAARFLRESQTVLYLHVTEEGRIAAWNSGAAARLGLTGEELRAARLEELLPEDDLRRLGLPPGEAPRSEVAGSPLRVNFVDAHHRPFTLLCQITGRADGLHIVGEDVPGDREQLSDTLMRLNRELTVMTREQTRRSRELAETKGRLEETLAELETSYWHLKKVQEVIPVCMHCERIRGDDATWGKLVEYLRSNSIFVSHGLCPECMESHYGELFDEDADEPGGTDAR